MPSAPRGIPQVEVAFDIDANGILNVSAKDMATGKEQKITITGASGLDKHEVEKMVHEAEGHADEDKKKKEVIELRNQLDTLIYSTEKLLTENRAKLPEDEIKAVEEALAEAKKTVSEDQKDADVLKKAMDGINSASHKIAEELYKKASAQPGAQGAQSGAGAGQGEVVDAEVVDDKK